MSSKFEKVINYHDGLVPDVFKRVNIPAGSASPVQLSNFIADDTLKAIVVIFGIDVHISVSTVAMKDTAIGADNSRRLAKAGEILVYASTKAANKEIFARSASGAGLSPGCEVEEYREY